MMTTCLVADETTFIREIYRLCMQDLPLHIVDEISDGEKALEKIFLLKPDIVLLDLILPLKNGLDILKECSALPTKFIVISSLSDEDYKQKAKALGAVAYIEKPFSKNELVSTVQLVLEKIPGVSYG